MGWWGAYGMKRGRNGKKTGPPAWSSATSPPPRRTGSGWPISPEHRTTDHPAMPELIENALLNLPLD